MRGICFFSGKEYCADVSGGKPCPTAILMHRKKQTDDFLMCLQYGSESLYPRTEKKRLLCGAMHTRRYTG